ncbi:MAG: hypothetical protein PF541_14390 [Prolixibacteraceae bacterium]|nr:hypothetical protein [Prolixibacteraceae bacterium]
MSSITIDSFFNICSLVLSVASFISTTSSVPFSIWAVLVALLLITGTVVLRYRRKRLA